MPIASTDALIAAMAGGHTATFTHYSPVNAGTGTAAEFTWSTGWSTGLRPGAVPGILQPVWCTSATEGALPLPALTGGNQWHLASVGYAGNGLFAVFDRLSHVRLPAPHSSTATVGLTLPARGGTGLGVTAYLDFHVNGPNTAATLATGSLAVSYTNSDGVAGRTGTIGSYGGTLASYYGTQSGLMMPLALQAGDKGVRSVQTVGAPSSAAGTNFTSAAAVVTVHLSRQVFLHYSPGAGIGFQTGFYDIGGSPLGVDPCLYVATGATNTNTRVETGTMRLIQA